MEALIWLGVFIVMVVVEMITMGITTVWFAGGAMVALLIAAFKGPVWLQIVVFLIVSIVLLIFTRPIVLKYFNNNRLKTNVDSLIGKSGIVTEDIDNLNAFGKVEVDGMEWTARTGQEDMKIFTGTKVVVERVEGVKLIVRVAV